MNGAQAARRPPPTGPTPPAPAAAPPAPPNNTGAQSHAAQAPPANRQPNGPVNGTHAHSQKGKKKSEPPVDPSQLYESLKNRIATLEEEEIHNEEEERRIGVSDVALVSLVNVLMLNGCSGGGSQQSRWTWRQCSTHEIRRTGEMPSPCHGPYMLTLLGC